MPSPITARQSPQLAANFIARPQRSKVPARPVPEPRPEVLVADQDPYSRRRLSTALRSRGFTVVNQCSGKALLTYFGNHLVRNEKPPIDVLVLDAELPNAHASEILTAFRTIGWRIPVIVVSSGRDPNLRQRATELGAAAVVNRPVNARVLAEFIAELHHPPVLLHSRLS